MICWLEKEEDWNANGGVALEEVRYPEFQTWFYHRLAL